MLKMPYTHVFAAVSLYSASAHVTIAAVMREYRDISHTPIRQMPPASALFTPRQRARYAARRYCACSLSLLFIKIFALRRC